jgi:dipeptidyl aminopeptidase/acylaminoacyl peptidase
MYGAGFVVFGRERSLMAQPFDLSRRQLSGEPFALGDQVTSRSAVYGDGLFSVASDGTLAYWNGGPSVTRLTWFDRKGETLGNTAKPGDYLSLALSADEKKIAVELVDPVSLVGDIWAIDAATGISSRLTTDPSWDFGPLWSRDGSTVIFGSIRSGRQSLYQTALASSGMDQLLLSSPDALGPSDWSFTSGLVVLQNMTQFKVGVMATADKRSPNLGFRSPFAEADGRLSPDGRWLAYTSNESGTWDVYVRSFPALDQKWRISPDGGSRPAWRPDGKELFFMAPDQTLMATPIAGGTQLSAGVPRPLFQMRTVPVPPTQARRQYAVSSQGDRFLVNTVVEPAVPTPVTIMLNWPAALRK